MSKGKLVPPVVSKKGAVGVRYPDYDFTLELIKEFGKLPQLMYPTNRPHTT